MSKIIALAFVVLAACTSAATSSKGPAQKKSQPADAGAAGSGSGATHPHVPHK